MATQQQKGRQGEPSSPSERDRSSASGSGVGASSTGERQETMSSSTASASSTPTSRSTMSGASSELNTGGTGSSGEFAGSSTGAARSGREGNGESGSSDLIRQVRSSASDAYSTVATKATEKLEEQKGTLTEGLHGFASTLRRIGSDINDPQTPETISHFASSYGTTAADKIEQAAQYFDTHDINAIYRDAERYARQNPGVVVGGALLLGFLAARFLRSSNPRSFGDYGNGRTTSGMGRSSGLEQMSTPGTSGLGH